MKKMSVVLGLLLAVLVMAVAFMRATGLIISS